MVKDNFPRNRRHQDDYDAHVIAGVVLSALKDMPLPIFFEVLDDITKAGMCENT